MLRIGDESDDGEPLYTLAQVKELARCSRTTIWRRLSRNEFPKPISPYRLLWRRSAIDNWLSGAEPANALTAPDFGAAVAHPSILQAIESGRFPAWFVDTWTNNGFAEAYGCDRRWLEDCGGRFEAAMRGDPATREDRLRELQRWLVGQCRRRRAHKRAAEFMLQWAAWFHTDAVHARYGPSWEAKLARAFGAAVALIRRARQEARSAGVALDRLDVVDLQAVAELVAREVLRGESVSVTDVLTAIKIHTAVVPLGEWVGEPAPMKHWSGGMKTGSARGVAAAGRGKGRPRCKCEFTDVKRSRNHPGTQACEPAQGLVWEGNRGAAARRAQRVS